MKKRKLNQQKNLNQLLLSLVNIRIVNQIQEGNQKS